MLICFSRIVDENVKKHYPSSIPLGGADDNFNRRIIEGIEKNGINPVLINFMPYHSYPIGRFLRYKREETIEGERKTINVGYINFPIIKQITIKSAILREVKKLLKHEKSANVLIYDSYPAFLDAAIALRKKSKNIKITLIAPTVPTYDVPRTDIKTRISRQFQKSLLKKDQLMDSYVFLTEHMNEVLNRYNRPYTIVEGIIPDEKEEEYADLDYRLVGKRYALYSGRLDRIYSIDKLISAFENRNDDLILALCGIGDYTQVITEKMRTNPHIVYLGFKNRPELNTLQKEALILINPRSAEGIYTRYSFPSKTMEYLLTGKPVIMHKLPGIPDEYDKYLYYIEEDSVEGIRRAVKNVLSDENRENKSKSGREFVLKEKNEKKQAKKVLDLINDN